MSSQGNAARMLRKHGGKPRGQATLTDVAGKLVHRGDGAKQLFVEHAHVHAAACRYGESEHVECADSARPLRKGVKGGAACSHLQGQGLPRKEAVPGKRCQQHSSAAWTSVSCAVQARPKAQATRMGTPGEYLHPGAASAASPDLEPPTCEDGGLVEEAAAQLAAVLKARALPAEGRHGPLPQRILHLFFQLRHRATAKGGRGLRLPL